MERKHNPNFNQNFSRSDRPLQENDDNKSFPSSSKFTNPSRDFAANPKYISTEGGALHSGKNEKYINQQIEKFDVKGINYVETSREEKSISKSSIEDVAKNILEWAKKRKRRISNNEDKIVKKIYFGE